MNLFNNGRGRWVAPLLATASVLVSSSAFAVGSAVLTGTVIDAATNRPAPDVVVTVTSPSLQGEQVVVTDGAGQYRIPNLPPGTYTLRLDKEAYKPYSRGGIELRIDSTIRVNTQLLPEAIQAKDIVVVAEPPTVDVGSSATGVNVGSEFVRRVPLIPASSKGAAAQSFESLAEVAPGAVADRYGVSISGTTSPENQYVIDGLSVNNPGFGILGTPLSVEFIDEVNVITGGYMPEYGRATGGYYNVVTKSGSNEFHGSVFFSITPGLFEGARTPVVREGTTITTDTRLYSLRSFGAEVGGPILKDKLWFYAGIAPSFATYQLERNLNIIRTQDGNPVVENGLTRTDRLSDTKDIYYAKQQSIQYIGKLTWLINRDNTLTLSVYGTPTTSGGDGTFGFNPRDNSIETDTLYSSGILNGAYSALAHEYVASATDVSLAWSSAFQNKKLLLDVTLGMHHEENAIRASDGTKVGSGKGLSEAVQALYQLPRPITDFEASGATAPCNEGDGGLCPVAGYYVGGPGFLSEAVLDRYQGKAMVTGLFEGFGHHVVKGGVDVEVMRYDHERGYSGDTVIWEDSSGGFYDFRRYGFLVGPDDFVSLGKYQVVSTSATFGGFVQDSWSIADRVTLNVGLRYDAQLLYGDGDLAMSLPNQWSPRVGVIYDVTQSGRSKLFANYARFYESVPLNIIDRAIPGERFLFSFRNPGACDPRLFDPYDPAQREQQQLQCESDDGRVVVHGPESPNAKWIGYGSDQVPVDPDIDAQSSDEIVVGGEYEVLPRLRVGAQYTKRWQNRVIEDLSRDEGSSFLIGNPGYGAAKDFPKAERDYDAFTVFLQKTFSGGWLAQGSYTLSYLRGNWSGLFKPETRQIDPNMNSDFDLASLVANRDGPLPGDRTHQIKLFGAKDFVFRNGLMVHLGGAYRARSGAPTSYLGGHLLAGPDESFILPRGSGERLPWVHDIDAHVAVGMQLAKDVTMMLAIDSFNIFNFQGVTAVDERYTGAEVLPIPGGSPSDLGKLQYADGSPFNPSEKNPNFGNPTAYQAPRTFRISARATF